VENLQRAKKSIKKKNHVRQLPDNARETKRSSKHQRKERLQGKDWSFVEKVRRTEEKSRLGFL
jgi:hypothetical protein